MDATISGMAIGPYDAPMFERLASQGLGERQPPHPRPWRRRLRRLLVTVLVIYAAWLIVLFLAQDLLLFPRAMANARYLPAPTGVETWSLKHRDAVVTEALFVPAMSGTAPHPTITLFHGNAMLAQDWLDWADELSRSGWNVLIPEFRGYGASGGRPAREALVADAVDALDRLTTDARVDASRLVVYGRSIGGAIAAEAVARRAALPAALILHTTPARLSEFAWRYGAPPLLVRNRFDAEAAMKALHARNDSPSCRVLILGHRQDEIVPASNASRLAVAAGVEAVEVDGSHNDYGSESARREAESALQHVLREVGG